MGLDMCINRTDREYPDCQLAYWRKHPNLHGYIVREFAGGLDECQEIALDPEKVEKTIAAVQADELPHTVGFFFGQSPRTNAGMD